MSHRSRRKHCAVCHELINPRGKNRARGEIYNGRLIHRRCRRIAEKIFLIGKTYIIG